MQLLRLPHFLCLGNVLKSMPCPDPALSHTGYTSQALTAQTDSPPSPQPRNPSSENVISSQGNLGSFILERTHAAAANLQTKEEGYRGTESDVEQKETELPINQF